MSSLGPPIHLSFINLNDALSSSDVNLSKSATANADQQGVDYVFILFFCG